MKLEWCVSVCVCVTVMDTHRNLKLIIKVYKVLNLIYFSMKLSLKPLVDYVELKFIKKIFAVDDDEQGRHSLLL